ncbi:hypothetical protein IC762_30055 [Bradyrhizobium genosp. L]|uniref:hypothetical protein n=1 Tax=Bradyrhizobium genosp. L TaxID=83637 RepID=UPI0018A2F656|nr:hypothetical protein [Bradyrhizobium genosp. L]QPF83870.1 hypothetical protein IC762_30055 [Bradyrhizobium genosp. L]
MTLQFLIQGSEKVIGHYQRLLDTAASEEERARYRDRIEEEQHRLGRLQRSSQARHAA